MLLLPFCQRQVYVSFSVCVCVFLLVHSHRLFSAIRLKCLMARNHVLAMTFSIHTCWPHLALFKSSFHSSPFSSNSTDSLFTRGLQLCHPLLVFYTRRCFFFSQAIFKIDSVLKVLALRAFLFS